MDATKRRKGTLWTPQTDGREHYGRHKQTDGNIMDATNRRKGTIWMPQTDGKEQYDEKIMANCLC